MLPPSNSRGALAPEPAGRASTLVPDEPRPLGGKATAADASRASTPQKPPLAESKGKRVIEMPAEPPEPYMVHGFNEPPVRNYCVYGWGDYLYWWVREQTIPSVLTTGTGGQLLGRPDIDLDNVTGVRIMVGTWINSRNTLGIEGGGFYMFERSATATLNFGGSAAINRPFFETIVSENSEIANRLQLWGAELNLRRQCCCTGTGCVGGYFDMLGGFRFLDLGEQLTVSNQTVFGTAPVLLSDATVTTFDSFTTHNKFYGGQLGAETGWVWNNVWLNAYGKVAVGINRQNVLIEGRTDVIAPTAPLGSLTAQGGFLAQPSNSGRFSRDEFAVVPEVGVNVGYKVCENFRLGIGYTFVYFDNVLRPGEQMEGVAATRPPLFFLGQAGAGPTFTFRETDFWAHGVNVRVEVSY
ncbi:MAG: BBP7 family outer membrane beta-barrel protein [Gemmataceae bacterium]|nr:BBP7 family outer membrane beta-barrel protein [Gemmataceae bacterium]